MRYAIATTTNYVIIFSNLISPLSDVEKSLIATRPVESELPEKKKHVDDSNCGFTINIVLFNVFTRPLHAARRISKLNYVFQMPFIGAHVNHNTLCLCVTESHRDYLPEEAS